MTGLAQDDTVWEFRNYEPYCIVNTLRLLGLLPSNPYSTIEI
jgi:hypothetical protein